MSSVFLSAVPNVVSPIFLKSIILIIEIKPYKFLNDPMVISKRIYGKKFCKEKGYKYITLSEKDIFKKSFLNFYDYII